MTTKNSRILATLAVACVALLCTDASAGRRDFFMIAEVDRPRAEEHGFQGVALNDAGAVVGSVILPDEICWYTGPNGKGFYFVPAAITPEPRLALTLPCNAPGSPRQSLNRPRPCLASAPAGRAPG